MSAGGCRLARGWMWGWGLGLDSCGKEVGVGLGVGWPVLHWQGRRLVVYL